MAAPASTPLAGRRSRYLDMYASTVMAAYRSDQIRRDIQDEQSRVQYLDSLIAQARQTAAGLELALQTQAPASLEAATALLQARYETENRDLQRQAASAAISRREATLSKAELDELKGQPGKVARLIRDPATSQAKADALLDYARSGKSGFDPKAVAQIEEGYRAPQRRKVSMPAKSAEEQAQDQALKQMFEATYFAGPSGIVGGYNGQAVADLRKSTVAPKGTSFSTAEDAFEAAIAATANGSITPDDFASQEDYEFAKQVYDEAKATKAYRNDQRANFENSVLTARKEVADLEAKRAQQIGTTYEDPAQEAMRRELQARGYTFAKRGSPDEWKNAYVKYQKTPDYGIYIGAHERVRDAMDKEKPLAPSNRAENIVTTYTMMKNRRGEPITIDGLRQQLDRVGIEGKLQEQAIAFGLAYWELGGPEQDPAMLKQRKEAEDIRMKDELARDQSAAAVAAEAKKAKEVVRQLEAQQVEAVGVQRERAAALNAPYEEYKRLRSEGVEEVDARAAAAEMFKAQKVPEAQNILLGAEFRDARDAIRDVQREAAPEPQVYPGVEPFPRSPAAPPDITRVPPAAPPQGEELVFGGGVVPEAAPPAPKAKVKRPAAPPRPPVEATVPTSKVMVYNPATGKFEEERK